MLKKTRRCWYLRAAASLTSARPCSRPAPTFVRRTSMAWELCRRHYIVRPRAQASSSRKARQRRQASRAGRAQARRRTGCCSGPSPTATRARGMASAERAAVCPIPPRQTSAFVFVAVHGHPIRWRRSRWAGQKRKHGGLLHSTYVTRDPFLLQPMRDGSQPTAGTGTGTAGTGTGTACLV